MDNIYELIAKLLGIDYSRGEDFILSSAYTALKEQQAEIERLREECEWRDKRIAYLNNGNAKLQAVVDAAKGVTEYGEVAFMGVNIPFKSFRKLKEALAALKEADDE